MANTVLKMDDLKKQLGMTSRTIKKVSRKRNFADAKFLNSNHLDPADYTDINKTKLMLRVSKRMPDGTQKKTWFFRASNKKKKCIGDFPLIKYEQAIAYVQGKQKMQTQIEVNATFAKISDDLTLGELFDDFIYEVGQKIKEGNAHISENTYLSYVGSIQNHLRKRIGNLPANGDTTSQIWAAIEDIKDDKTTATANACFKNLTGIFKWAYGNTKVTFRDHMKGLAPTFIGHKPKGKKNLNGGQYEQLVKLCFDYDRTTDRMNLIMLSTGLRLSNVVAMRVDNINFEKGIVTLEADQMKRKVPFIFPLNSFAMMIVKQQIEYKQDRRRKVNYRKSPYLFPSQRFDKGDLDKEGNIVTEWKHANRSGPRNRIQNLLKGTYKQTDKQKPSPHTLRKTFRTMLSKLGVDKETGKRLIHHASGDQMDDLYDLNLKLEEMGKASEKMSEHLLQTVRS